MSQHEDFGLRKTLGNAAQHSHGLAFGHDIRLGIVAAAVVGVLSGITLHQEGWETVALVTATGAVVATVLVHVTEFSWNLWRAPQRLRDEALDRLIGRVTELENAPLERVTADLEVAREKAKSSAMMSLDRYFTVESDGVRWAKLDDPLMKPLGYKDWHLMEARCPEHDTFTLQMIQIVGNKEYISEIDESTPLGRFDNGTLNYWRCIKDSGHTVRADIDQWPQQEKVGELKKVAYSRWMGERRERVQRRNQAAAERSF